VHGFSVSLLARGFCRDRGLETEEVVPGVGGDAIRERVAGKEARMSL